MSTSPEAIPPTGPGFASSSIPLPGSEVVETNSEAKTYGMLCHLLALAGFIIPFGNIIGPLVMWMLKKEQYKFVDDQGKEALNFQITVMIAALICFALMFLLIGFVLLPAVGIASLVFIILAAVKASGGFHYRYPYTIRLIK